MDIEFDEEIDWNGRALTRWATVDGRRIQFFLQREMIHDTPIYNDLIEREIKRYRFEIFDRLKPRLLATLKS